MIRLLAVDMDGTCLDSRSRITDRTLGALRRAAAAGIEIVPATGRSMACIPHRLAVGTIRREGLYAEETYSAERHTEEPHMRRLHTREIRMTERRIPYLGKSRAAEDARKNRGLFRYVITSNGAQVTDIEERRAIFREMIPKGTALSLLDACRDIPVGVTSHINHEYLLQGRILVLLGHLIYGKDAGGVRWVKDMKKTVRVSRYEVEELQFYFLSPSARRNVQEVLQSFPELEAAYTGLYVEVFAKGASKGNALSALASHLGIRKEEIACIGDGENDLSMFRAAGMKIAMDNAVPEVKEKADLVTASNNRDGVAEAVEKILRGRSKIEVDYVPD